MKIIQTYWHFEDNDESIFEEKAGWLNADLHWLSWSFSCLQLLKNFNEVTLYTNKIGKKILVETLKLPYTNVVILDSKLNISRKSWVLAKIYTYSIQKEPFIHIDGDLFIFNNVFNKVWDSQLVVQNLEINFDFYIDFITKYDLFSFLENYGINVSLEGANLSINAGIFGGSNLEFIKKYAKICVDITNFLENLVDIEDIQHYNMFIEQFLFLKLAQKEKLQISTIVSDISDVNYYELIDFSKNIVHVMGNWKRIDNVIIQMLKYFEINNKLFFVGVMNQLYSLIKNMYVIVDVNEILNISTFINLNEECKEKLKIKMNENTFISIDSYSVKVCFLNEYNNTKIYFQANEFEKLVLTNLKETTDFIDLIVSIKKIFSKSELKKFENKINVEIFKSIDKLYCLNVLNISF